MISPATAAALGVEHEDVVEIAHGGAAVRLPVYVLPGHADGCVSVELGYGRRAGGPIAEGVGEDVYPIRPLATPALALGARITPTGERRTLATTQQHFDQHGRGIALTAELERYRAHPDFTAAHRGPQPSLLPDDLYRDPPQWAMTIDIDDLHRLQRVRRRLPGREQRARRSGKEGVLRSREMHWLRIDTYLAGDVDDARGRPPADALPALREGALRVRLPGQRHRRTAPTA